jgi:hypothetical protein
MNELNVHMLNSALNEIENKNKVFNLIQQLNVINQNKL